MHATGFRHGGRLWVTCLGLLLVGTIARADDLSKEERDAGFVAMFNGKDFTGWRFEGKESPPKELPDNWKVEEGAIKLSGGGKPHLGSAKSYRDFEMKFEWRAVKENYNSGFFIRSGEKVGANQINLAKAHEGAFIGGKINGERSPAVAEEAGRMERVACARGRRQSHVLVQRATRLGSDRPATNGRLHRPASGGCSAGIPQAANSRVETGQIAHRTTGYGEKDYQEAGHDKDYSSSIPPLSAARKSRTCR